MVSILIDETMLLRSYQPDDAAALFRSIDAARSHLRPWLSWVDHTIKQEHSLQFIQQSLQELNQQQSLALGIFHHQEIIGGIGMHHWDQALKKAQIGYWISPGFEGKGIVTKCASRFVDFLFEKLKLNKVEIHFALPNKRSAGVGQRLGMKTEGVIRASCLINGRLEDIVVTGILKQEWGNRP